MLWGVDAEVAAIQAFLIPDFHHKPGDGSNSYVAFTNAEFEAQFNRQLASRHEAALIRFGFRHHQCEPGFIPSARTYQF